MAQLSYETSARVLIIAFTSFLAACAAQRPEPPSPAPAQPAAERPIFTQEGIASWYGRVHDGRKTASGDIYDMNALTAAHRNLPFGTVVRVTNLDNGRMAKVRINDRGPYVDSRIIDLSAQAARALGMRQSGTARVRIEQFVSDQPPTS
jgi:rare lipoprotein A